jgi:hypothetical protein
MFIRWVLVAPEGSRNLDFFEYGFNPAESESGTINLDFLDSASAFPDQSDAPTADSFEASDTFPLGHTDTFSSHSAPTYDTSIPQVRCMVNCKSPTSPTALNNLLTSPN